MNYFVPHEFDPSSQNHGSYDQFTYNSNSYSYSYPNPQFSSSIHPYSYQNPYVQPSQHEEQEPNPPGVTPPPPPRPMPEMCRNSYYQYQAQAAAAGVPTAGPQPAPVDAGVQTVIHQPIVQPLYGGVGVMDGIVPRGDPHTYLGPKLNISSSAFRVDGFDIGHSLPMNAATPFQDHSATAYGGIHIQGGPCQPLSQSIGEPHHGPRPKVSGRTYRVRGRGKGCVQRKHAVAPAQDQKLLFQGKSEIQGAATLPMVQSGASSIGQTLLPLQAPAHSASVSPSPKVVSCELCKVECNTLEVLQQHVNGKKHKKKLKVFEELQNLNKKVISGQADQTPTIELKSEVVSQPDRAEGSGNQQLEQEVLPSQEINEESKVAGEKHKVEEVEHPEESAKKMRVDHCERIGRGFKHKMRGGKSNRKMRPSDRPKILVQPPKPKEVTPLVCELCNVKCESLAVFQSHLAGKKHKSKAKRFLSQERFGQELPQAQRPATMQGFSAYHVASAQNVDTMTSGVVDPEPLVTNAGASFLLTTATGGTWNKGRSETGAEMVGVAAGSEQAVTCGTALDGGSSSEQNVVSIIQPPPN
ncbi:uncharacterized protein LOC131020627 [Salvia miltiorrhiza]|uniref:uncharacterized protein LOC131020627 n=1 Tax=Salvia miltiorrhiza TaxID=226208 RepID=UPI0025ABF131|nr:uncharacterized protein LOC131020627 [Salvia miltiorrhiza]